jgi:hypothetical protein
MNNLETDEGTKQLVASEASAGAKGGGDDSANARHASRKEGTGDLSSGDPEAALKSKKRRERLVRYRQNMPAEKRATECQRLDSIRMNETPEKREVRLEKECKQSATRRSNQSDKVRAKSCEYIRDYMRKKRAKVKATTLPPSPDEEEEVDATADPPPSSPGEQGDACRDYSS